MSRTLINSIAAVLLIGILLPVQFLVPTNPVSAATAREILKPTVAAHPGDAFTATASAYDSPSVANESSTDAFNAAAKISGTQITFTNWASAGQPHDARRLYVRRDASGFTNDTWTIDYSTDGGAGWTSIETGNGNVAAGSTTAVDIANGLTLDQLQVRVTYSKSTGWDAYAISITDVWLEGDHTAGATSPTLPGTTPGNGATGVGVDLNLVMNTPRTWCRVATTS
jgi:hypothetical protein